MGLGQSKKTSPDSQTDVRASQTRASRQSSEYSIKSERFVSPPTSPIPSFTQSTAQPDPSFSESAVDAPSTGVTKKISYAYAAELEKRLTQLQCDRSSPKTANETSKYVHHQRQEQQFQQQVTQKTALQQKQQEQPAQKQHHLQSPQQHQSQNKTLQEKQHQGQPAKHQWVQLQQEESLKNQLQQNQQQQPAQFPQLHQFHQQFQKKTLQQDQQQLAQQQQLHQLHQQFQKKTLQQDQHQLAQQQQLHQLHQQYQKKTVQQEQQHLSPQQQLQQLQQQSQKKLLHHQQHHAQQQQLKQQQLQQLQEQKQQVHKQQQSRVNELHKQSKLQQLQNQVIPQQEQEVQQPLKQQSKQNLKQQKETPVQLHDQQPHQQVQQSQEPHQLQEKQQTKQQAQQKQIKTQPQQSQQKSAKPTQQPLPPVQEIQQIQQQQQQQTQSLQQDKQQTQPELGQQKQTDLQPNLAQQQKLEPEKKLLLQQSQQLLESQQTKLQQQPNQPPQLEPQEQDQQRLSQQAHVQQHQQQEEIEPQKQAQIQAPSHLQPKQVGQQPQQTNQQQAKQQQQHNQEQLQNHKSRKTRKQLKREQRLVELQQQQQQLANDAQQDNKQHQTEQQPHKPNQKQAKQPLNQASTQPQRQPQSNQQKQQPQPKILRDQEILKPELQQKQPLKPHPRDEKQTLPQQQAEQLEVSAQRIQKNQNQEQQIQPVGETGKHKLSKQTPETSQIKQQAANQDQDEPSNDVVLRVEPALIHKPKEGANAELENTRPRRHVIKTQQRKPVPLMTINFPKEASNSSLQAPGVLPSPTASNRQQNQQMSLHATQTNTGAPTQPVHSITPLKQAPTPTGVCPNITSSSHQISAQSKVSKNVAHQEQIPLVPCEQKAKTPCNIGSGNLPEHVDSLEHKEEISQKQNELMELLQSQHQQQHQHQQELTQKQLRQEQQKQKLKQHPQQKLQKQQKSLQPQQDEEQEEVSSTATQLVLQRRTPIKAVHKLQPHPPEFAASAAALQAELALKQPAQPPHTARKRKPVDGDATMEIFKSLEAQDSSAVVQTKADVGSASKTGRSGTTTQQSVAPWAVVCDKMPDQDFLKKPPTSGKGKRERKEGQGFLSRIFGRKNSPDPTPPKHRKAKKESADLEIVSAGMLALKIDSATSVQQTEAQQGIDTDQDRPATESPASNSDVEDGSFSAESDESSDVEPPSCIETWEIADDVVEKALSLLPIQVGSVHCRRYTVPDCPFEPEFVQRLVSDALEAKRGLKRIKEDQALLETFRDNLLKFFEEKDPNDILPPCNHPPGSNQCNMQPVIQPLLGIIRYVLQERKTANEPPKEAAVRPRESGRGHPEHAEPRPRRYIKIKRKLSPGQNSKTPTKLLVRFCNACADTKQPDGRPLMSCTRCQDVVYCSRECMNVDWITHKFTCPGGDRRSYCKHHGT